MNNDDPPVQEWIDECSNNINNNSNNVIVPIYNNGYDYGDKDKLPLDRVVDDNYNDKLSSEHDPLIKKGNSDALDAGPIWRQAFFKDKVMINVFFALGMCTVVMSGLMLPLVFTEYVKYHHPTYTSQQVESEAAHLKSIADSLPYVANFLLSPLLGMMSDRIGRKWIMALIQLLQIIDMLMIGLASWKKVIIPLYISHSLAGVSNGMISIVFSYLADITTKAERATWFIIVGTGMGISLAGSPLIEILFLKFSFNVAVFGNIGFLIAGMFCLLPIVNSLHYSEGRLKPASANLVKANTNPFSAILMLFRSSKYIIFYALLNLSFNFTLQDTLTTSFYYTQLRYGWIPWQCAVSTSLIGVAVFVWSGIAIPLLLRWFSERLLVVVCFFCSATFHIAYTFAFDQYMWQVSICLGSFSLVIINLIQSIISKATPPDIQGTVLSGVSSLASLGAAAGSYSSANIFAYFISSSAPFYMPGMQFLVNAVLIYITCILSLIVYKRVPEPRPRSSIIDAEEKVPVLSINA
ncbi:hypothetical protein SAMD00019534_023590 [Acytostelium subglobosum LB1]|uniref:hypothetical protein n=1 Tax=Acytostelium subglobosum LB1 TaxID=1410327 RepID=UPI000644B6D0|nr:hypothetical protein SAMD00019534_023590 [Acytostelium subglobosum LB1]GAM19184.1 hypothetical protein SAMD00019534_023590 [Acytostelium subglobosum LB1]|eukprot:XP_012757111.1 hypothetical protein SAMD00019534_023590 [Acytostelium subglobosum LB1]